MMDHPGLCGVSWQFHRSFSRTGALASPGASRAPQQSLEQSPPLPPEPPPPPELPPLRPRSSPEAADTRRRR